MLPHYDDASKEDEDVSLGGRGRGKVGGACCFQLQDCREHNFMGSEKEM